jgi:WhiB family redox-sensing transcriptional regulator
VGCLSGALERNEPWGVWGGELLEEGRVCATKRPRGRPVTKSIRVTAVQEVPIPAHLVA